MIDCCLVLALSDHNVATELVPKTFLFGLCSSHVTKAEESNNGGKEPSERWTKIQLAVAGQDGRLL